MVRESPASGRKLIRTIVHNVPNQPPRPGDQQPHGSTRAQHPGRTTSHHVLDEQDLVEIVLGIEGASFLPVVCEPQLGQDVSAEGA